MMTHTHKMCICSVIKESKRARISINHLFPFVFCATNWKPVELNDLRYKFYFFSRKMSKCSPVCKQFFVIASCNLLTLSMGKLLHLCFKNIEITIFVDRFEISQRFGNRMGNDQFGWASKWKFHISNRTTKFGGIIIGRVTV